MKETIKIIFIKIVVLGAIFAGAVVGISMYMNRTEVVTSIDMEDASLPLIYLKLNEVPVNEMHGYTSEMQANLMRDTLTPLPSDKVLPIEIITYDSEVSALSYEIISPIDNSVVESKLITSYQTTNDVITTDLALENNMKMNQEYVLKIILTVKGEKVYYYTRVLQQERLYTDEYVAFVNDFFNSCVNKSGQDSIIKNIEPDLTTDNSNLATVTINSSVEQFTWGDLAIEVKVSPTLQIKDINSTTAYMVLEYVVSYLNENNVVEFYDVYEFYRLRYKDSKVVLLNFERTVAEIVNPDGAFITDEGIYLGIGNTDIPYMTNDAGTIVSFIQGNELWQYNSESNEVIQIFSFRDRTNEDLRQIYNQSEISMVNMDSDGNMDFIVYGYMNRGEHEGAVGIAVYHLDAGTENVEERVFIPSDEPYEILKLDPGRLSYINSSDTLFFMLNQTVYQVELVSREYIMVASGLEEGKYAIDDDGSNFAWISSTQSDSGNVVNVIDFDDGRIYTVTAGSDEMMNPLGFIDDDFIYGLAKNEDISMDVLGNTNYPMYSIIIRNAESLVKEYKADGIYVTEVLIEDSLVTLTRATKIDGSFVETTEDYIVSNETKAVSAISITSVNDESAKKTQNTMELGIVMPEAKPKTVRTKFMIFEQSRELPIDKKEKETETYYVYGRGHLDSIYKNANAAIKRANELLGVVVTGKLEYVWIRGDVQTPAEMDFELDVDSIPEVMKQGIIDISTIQAGIEGTIIDLSGCSLEEIRYFVSAGYPVLVQAGGDVRTIVGYDVFMNTILYNQDTNLTYKLSEEDSEELFESAGNVFVSYMIPKTN